MNRFLPATLNVSLFLISSLVAFTGGYLVADWSIWTLFFCSLFSFQFIFDDTIKKLEKIVTPFWEKLLDRSLLFQANDPLLI